MKDEKLYCIGWSLSTSPEWMIIENAIDDGIEPDAAFWDDVNENIHDFESKYRDILRPYVTYCCDEGHDLEGDLVGSAFVTEAQIDDIKNKFEFCRENEYVLTQSSGNFCTKETDTLMPQVCATLTFWINDEVE